MSCFVCYLIGPFETQVLNLGPTSIKKTPESGDQGGNWEEPLMPKLVELHVRGIKGGSSKLSFRSPTPISSRGCFYTYVRGQRTMLCHWDGVSLLIPLASVHLMQHGPLGKHLMRHGLNPV